MTKNIVKISNPGSDAALKMGCACPVLDNNHGKGMVYQGSVCHWANGSCHIHGIGGLTELAWADRRCGGEPTREQRYEIACAICAAADDFPEFVEWAWSETDNQLMGWTDEQYVAGCLCILAGFK